MSLFAGSSFFLYGEFSVCSKEDLKAMIEKNGGQVCTRTSAKTSYILFSGHTRESLDKAKSYNIPVLSDLYIIDCINAKKRLPTANYIPGMDKKVLKRSHSSEELGDIYNFAETTDNHNKENRINKLKQKLKRISLGKNGNNKREKEDDADHNMIISSKKLKKVTKRSDGGEADTENIPSLKDLVFYLYGQFSIPPDTLTKLILDNGGRVACAVDDSVTHFLFGGESVDIPEFQDAQRRKIHIVNEYFLRLLVKY